MKGLKNTANTSRKGTRKKSEESTSTEQRRETLPKAVTYEDHQREMIELVTSDQYLFINVAEAAMLYRPAMEDAELCKRLVEDPAVLREFTSHIVKVKAKLRHNMMKSGARGSMKQAKLILDTFAEREEWARINGKSFGDLALLDKGEDGKVAVSTLSTASNAELTAEIKRRQKDAKALLADSTAVDVATDDGDDKIEVEY